MSRGYGLPLMTLSGVVNSENSMDLKVQLLTVLCPEDMCGLLKDELAAQGWVLETDGGMTKPIGDAVARLEPDGSNIRVTLNSKQNVSATEEGEEETNLLLNQVKARAEKVLSEKNEKALMALEPSLREQINTVVQKVYLEALKRKAATMGTIESVVEGGDGEVTIKVRV